MSLLRRLFLLSLIAVAAPTCASRWELDERTPEQRLVSGLAAIRVGNFAMAVEELRPVAESERATPAREEARLLLATIELDPRNPDGDPETGAALAAELAGQANRSPMTTQIATILYLFAREMGAKEPAVADSLPSLNGPSLAARLEETRAERDRQRVEIERLGQEIRAKDQEIKKLKQELERIRKTLQY